MTVTEYVGETKRGPKEEVPRDVVKHITVSGAKSKQEAEEAAIRRMGKKADGHKGIKSYEVEDDHPNAPTHVDLTPAVCHACGRPSQETTQ